MASANTVDCELTAELQGLCETLDSSVRGALKMDNLQQQLQALKRLHQIARNDVSKCHGFLLLMSMYAKVPLQQHIEEVRTALSTEACAVVAAFAEHSSNRAVWRTAAEWFVPSLLRLTMRTNRVCVKAALGTLEVLARTNSFGSGAFVELIRGCTARHATTRSCAFNVLQLVIERSKNDSDKVFSYKYVDAVCGALRVGLADADAGTRRCARRCYWAFRDTEPGAAQALYKGLEKTARRPLDRGEDRGQVKTTDAAMVRTTFMSDAKRNSKKKETTRNVSLLVTTTQSVNKDQGDVLAKKLNVEKNKIVGNAAETWDSVQEALRSTLWSERLLGVQRISEEFSHFQNKLECVRMLIPRLNDPKCQVSEAALQALRVVRECSPLLLKNELPEVVAALLVNMSDSRAVLSRASREHLLAIVQMNSLDDVMHAIYRTLGDITSEKVKVHAVKFAQYLFEQNTRYFEQTSPMRMAVTQLLHSLQSNQKGGDLHKTGVSALVTLYVTAKSAFLRTLLQLAPNEQKVLLEILEPAIPQLAQECRRCSLNKKLLRHASPHAQVPFAEKVGGSGDVSPLSGTGSEKRSRLRRQAQAKSLTLVREVTHNSETCGVSVTNERTNVGKSQPELKSCKAFGVRSFSDSRQMSSRRPPMSAERQIHQDPVAPVMAALPDRVMCDDDTVAGVLDRLEGACEVLETAAVLDQICRMFTVNPKLWVSAFGRLFIRLEKLIPQSSEPHHAVRRRGFVVLRIAVEQAVLWPSISRCLKRVFLLVRLGLDDVFLEVSAEANAVLQIILTSGVCPTDHCLNALALSLEVWLCGEDEYSSRGWLTLLESVEHIFSRSRHHMTLVQDNLNEKVTLQDASSAVVSEPVLRRVCSAAIRAVQHSVSEVRLTAVLSCVSIWVALGTAALPHLVGLTASQRKLVSLYYNKVACERMSELKMGEGRPCDMGHEMRRLGLPEASCL